MTDQFLAEIRVFPFTFAPTGWAFCDGQLLPISQNTALFALLGTMYGGDGKSTFALPNLQGRAPLQHGHGAGLTPRVIGEQSGSAQVTLLQSEIPAHSHVLRADVVDVADTSVPNPNAAFGLSSGGTLYQASANAQLDPTALAVAGGSLPHNNMQPYLPLNFCIALQGIFPQRP
ncbi:phage tail protein [Nocardioides sp. R1-1]|uniref:phage tail protein n=1 Tax=Nocardioides sp. R1-1 TaxID=3383502 RepID=UPI0038D02DA7